MQPQTGHINKQRYCEGVYVDASTESEYAEISIFLTQKSKKSVIVQFNKVIVFFN